MDGHIYARVGEVLGDSRSGLRVTKLGFDAPLSSLGNDTYIVNFHSEVEKIGLNNIGGKYLSKDLKLNLKVNPASTPPFQIVKCSDRSGLPDCDEGEPAATPVLYLVSSPYGY